MQKERLYYIDWLRVLVILSLVPFHAALTYTGLGDTYITTLITDLKVLPFLVISLPLGSFFMTLLFFISGMAAYYSFQSRGHKEFLTERVRKVLLPFLFGTIFLCPLQAYFKGLYDGFSGGFISFLPEFFSVKIVQYLGYAHLWFLLYLFVFTLLCLPLFKKWSIQKEKLEKLSVHLCKGNNIYYPITFIIFAEMILRPFSSGMQTLIMDWANDVVYLSMLIFGFVFASDNKIQERLERLKRTAGIIFLVLSILYIIIFYLLLAEGIDLVALWVATKGIYECSAILYLLWFGKRYFNKKSKVLNYINKASFTYYLYHFIPVSFFTYYFAYININVYFKYLLVVILSYLSIFIIYEVFIKRYHGLIKKINYQRRGDDLI